MTTIAKLVEVLAEWDGREPASLSDIAQRADGAGYLPAPAGLSWTAAANLLIAANLPVFSDRPAVGIPTYRSLRRNFLECNPPLPDCFDAVAAAVTFGDAIEALLEDAVPIRQWLVEGQTRSEATEYIVGGGAIGVKLEMKPLLAARIGIWRKEDESKYNLIYNCTRKTLAAAENERVPDRQVEISISLPTILSVAGAVLGKDLIEDEAQAA